MMNSKTKMFLIFLFGSICAAKAQTNESTSKQGSVSQPINTGSASKNKFQNPEVKPSSVYLETGLIADKKLSTDTIKTDKDLLEKEFIIERSPNIKIVYTPNSKNPVQ
jgi:hypothetical protein